MAKDLETLVEGNNAFAFDLYGRLSQQPGNKFFSPYSISTALGMTYAGARGNTAKEMAQTLHFTLDKERLHPAFGELIRKIQGADNKRNYELATANSLWGDKTGLSLDPKFLRITQTDYQAGFRLVDFGNDAEGARRTINGWVEEKTNKKIEDLIPKGLFTNSTRLVLANAIYFKADWALQFPKEATKPGEFTIPGAPAFKVPMMHRTFEANYSENAEFQLAEFLYKGNEVSMVVILPKMMDGLSEVEKNLSGKALAQWMSEARPAQLQVALPKFKMTEALNLGHLS
jgi:serpin B